MSIPTRPSRRIKALIADRNCMASQLLAGSLAQDSQLNVSIAGTAAEIVSVSGSFGPDVVVISADLESVPRKGLQAARRLSAIYSHIKIIILIENLSDDIISCFRNGARGVFCRTEDLSEFRECVHAVSQGRMWVPNGVAEHLLSAIKSAPSCDTISQVSALSKREIEVAELAAQGLTNKQIADHLALSEHTVKNYLFRVFEKLKISNRIELLYVMVNENKTISSSVQGRSEEVESDARIFIEKYIESARDGFVPVQLVLALAHLEGYGAEKSEESAYYWLRMTENQCSQIMRLSQDLLCKLKGQIRDQKIESLEEALSTSFQNYASALSKKPIDLVRANEGMLSRLAG
jgi:two-component system, NarL family, nitrate/nitrite response regulator NarL